MELEMEFTLLDERCPRCGKIHAMSFQPIDGERIPARDKVDGNPGRLTHFALCSFATGGLQPILFFTPDSTPPVVLQ